MAGANVASHSLKSGSLVPSAGCLLWFAARISFFLLGFVCPHLFLSLSHSYIYLCLSGNLVGIRYPCHGRDRRTAAAQVHSNFWFAAHSGSKLGFVSSPVDQWISPQKISGHQANDCHRRLLHRKLQVRADIWFCCASLSFCLTISEMFYDFNVVISIHTNENLIILFLWVWCLSTY